MIRQAREWAIDAGDGAHGRGSRVEVGGGMTTITVTVDPTGSCVVRVPGTGEEYPGAELDVAMRTVRGLANRAMG